MTSRGRRIGARAAMAVIPLVILAPLAIVASGDRYNGRRVLEMVWAGGLVLALLTPAVRGGAWVRWQALRPVTRAAALGFIAWAGLSAALSVAPGYALREWGLGTLVVVSLLPLSVLWEGRSDEVRLTFAMTLVVYGIITLVRPEVHGFAHPRFQGQVLAVATPLLLFAGDATLALFAAPALAGGILAGSRALVAALIGVHLVALAAWSERRRRMLPALVSVGVAVALIVGAGLVAGPSEELVGAVGRGASDNGRLSIWAEVLRLLADAPLTGVGPGLTALYPTLDGWAGHPHSVTFTVLGETGIVGLALALALLYRFARMGLAAPARLHPWVLAVVAGVGHGQLSGTFVMPGAQITLAVVAAVLLAETGTPGEAAGVAPVAAGDPAGSSASRKGWLIFGLGVAAAVALALTVDLPNVRPSSNATWAPRFWIPGAIPR